MTIAERFDRYVAARVRINALEAQLKALQSEAEPDLDFIKEWFRARPEKRRNRGVAYSSSPFKYFNPRTAKALLGPEKTTEATETRYRESVSLDEQAKAVRNAGANLKPMRKASA